MSRRNPVRGEAPLVLDDGRRFTVVLDMEALVDAEASYRRPLAQLLADAKSGFMGASAALLQGALARHHPEVTRGDALEMLRTDTEKVAEVLDQAAKFAFPEATAGNAPEPGVAIPAGKRSGRNGAKRG